MITESRYFFDMETNYTKKRFKEIVSVSVKHGLKKGIGDPKELRLALEELGPTFIKLGQILSTRADILSKKYINELEKLQNDVTPEKFEVMKKVIENELNSNLEETFLSFKKEPIASASLSEVYLAKLKTGKEVVVKVQRPFVKEKMMADIAILKKLAPFINFTASSDVINAEEVIKELSNAAEKELDFINEKENIIRFNENNKDIKFITAPKVYEKFCTKKILVMDYLEGIKIDHIDTLKNEGYDLKDIATKLTYNYFKQIFEDGFFHADPHPGNILIYENKIGYIDFGLMGNIDSNLKKKFNELLEGIATRDLNLMTKSVLKIGTKKGSVNPKKLQTDIEIMYEQYIEESLYDFDLPQIMEEVMTVCKKNNIYMPKDVTLLIKGLMTIQGLIAKLDRDLNIMDIALPYVESHMIEKKLTNINLIDTVKYLYGIIKSNLEFSTKLSEFINQISNGELKLNLQIKNIEKSINELNKMVNRLVFAIVVAALLVSSSLAMNAKTATKIYGIPVIGLVGYLGAVVAGFWLLISTMKSGKL